ncbi:hypothetical protein EZY14_009215 [Kordia sp. TARA_039_SRF]|nr:hypothetical protein EZY14_009215 [Kordia sp. TARA_039_SRF]
MDVLNGNDPTLIWKYDKDGNERPLQEQLDRRKSDQEIAFRHIEWYSSNPLRSNALEREIAHKDRLNHLESIKADINRIEKLLKQ